MTRASTPTALPPALRDAFLAVDRILADIRALDLRKKGEALMALGVSQDRINELERQGLLEDYSRVSFNTKPLSLPQAVVAIS